MNNIISILIAITKAYPKLLPAILILAFAWFIIALVFIFLLIKYL